MYELQETDVSPVAVHPGVTLQMAWEDSGLSMEDFAQKCGLPFSVFLSLFQGKQAVTIEIAQKLVNNIGGDTAFWLDLQTEYEKAVLRSEQTSVWV